MTTRQLEPPDGLGETKDDLKRKARQAVYNAVRSGQLIRPDTCPKCNSKEKIVAHHHKGYEEKYWLDVEWLCYTCHLKSHDKINAKKKKLPKQRCEALGCRRSAFARGVCSKHYSRWRRLDDKGNGPLSRIEAISDVPDGGQSPGRPVVEIGNRKTNGNGYVYVKVDSNHMLARKDRRSGTWVLEHRLIMSEHLGRPLARNEIVKHKDENITNNDLGNLYIVGGEGDN